MARTFGRLLIKTLKDIDRAQKRAAKDRDRDQRKAMAVQSRYERDLDREQQRLLKVEQQRQVVIERERIRDEKALRDSAKRRIRDQELQQKANRLAVIKAGKTALAKRVKVRQALCQRFIDLMVE